MLTVVSSPLVFSKEEFFINAMFDEGLEVFHLRKPGFSINDFRKILDEIKPEFYSKLAIHSHYELADDYGITRIHFPEKI
ncbi:MAG: hypothetical protein ACYCOO_11920, partial [Chitinophagaceae bacterium]